MSDSPFFKAEMSGENNCRYYYTSESDTELNRQRTSFSRLSEFVSFVTITGGRPAIGHHIKKIATHTSTEQF